MAVRKRPTGIDWEYFVEGWYACDHLGKIALARSYDVSYDTAKHWVSENGATKAPKVFPPVELQEKPMGNSPLILRTVKAMTRAAVVGDFHHPFDDARLSTLVEDFIVEQNPDILIFNGDLNDFYQVSVFDKDPRRLGDLQKDLNKTKAMFAKYRKRLPNTRFIFIEGTHEHRWFKYLRQNAPALANLDGTNITELYKLNDYGVEFVPFEQGLLVNGSFLILHGDVVSKWSAMTAKRQFEKQGGSGIHNHTHRGGSFIHSNRFGEYGWYENFCMCTLNPDWVANPDWHHGMSFVTFDNTNKFFVEQLPIVNYDFIYGGRLYSG